MEENQVQEQVQNIDYSKDFEEVKKGNEDINKSIQELLNFFQTEKKEQKIQEEKEQKQLLEEQKIQEEEQNKLLEEENKEKEVQEEKQEEFYANIKTIATNTDTEVTTQLLTDVSTLMQVNVMTSGLLIGIICISLFAKFFKK